MSRVSSRVHSGGGAGGGEGLEDFLNQLFHAARSEAASGGGATGATSGADNFADAMGGCVSVVPLERCVCCDASSLGVVVTLRCQNFGTQRNGCCGMTSESTVSSHLWLLWTCELKLVASTKRGKLKSATQNNLLSKLHA